MFQSCLPTASAVLLLSLSPSLSLAATKQEYIDHTLNASDILNQQWYSQNDGMWQELWWNSGAILATIGDVALLNDGFKQTAVDIYSKSLTAAKAANGNSWLNEFYDDEGWWAMGWIKAYDVTQDTKYLDAANEIFNDLLTGNDATCGGHWWSKDKTDNTAIGNELYLAIAASLANRMDDGTSYQKYAQSQLDWFLGAGFFNENHTISDGLNVSSNCERIGAVYSYNQGVILGALVEMNTLTDNSSYLDIANGIAHAAIDQLAKPNNGVLTDVGYPVGPDPTGAQFKGVFARNLMYLHHAQPDDDFADFLQYNANSIWKSNRQGDGKLGAFWQGPLQNITAAAHSSALDCLLAAAAVSS
ncbi:glycoside hydrolase family 76 protein [Zasmidium cellare ATCC 36951]|uniref:Glycoside hydrolase family 76 protein n=1 Tax=Zasmidium cellare ATCC 36951 TaxID=1080233 RepID=A0A6A6BWR1_ZASCE|nr:glycoside hydrolase family 76 protein [Zasmidium cellare ATCC 36951]KAF2159217.1 glycoside hydrolase family 76 protein [Zasmidium cellare ATCC 36951]